MKKFNYQKLKSINSAQIFDILNFYNYHNFIIICEFAFHYTTLQLKPKHPQ